jgi:hypothetical protein
MPLPPTVELVCSFSTVETKPLSPFVWVLLKALETFPPGSRPEFDQLAEKLAFKDTHYLNDAWRDVIMFKLCECGEGQKTEPNDNFFFVRRPGPEPIDFEYARITESGLAALNDGFIRNGQPRKRTGEALYFTLRDGSPITHWKAHYEPKETGRLNPPNWADRITEKTIKEALKFQRESEDEHIHENEQIFNLEIHWEESRRVKLD